MEGHPGPHCRVTRSFLRTSATTAPSATRIRTSTKVENILRLVSSVPAGYGLPAIIGAKIGCPDVPVVGFAGDGAFGIAVTELTAIGRSEWPAITQIVFRNYQWGAEKRNSTLWYDDNFVGTELDEDVSFAGIAKALRAQRRRGMEHGRTHCRIESGDRGPDERWQDHLDRGNDQPGTPESLSVGTR